MNCRLPWIWLIRCSFSIFGWNFNSNGLIPFFSPFELKFHPNNLSGVLQSLHDNSHQTVHTKIIVLHVKISNSTFHSICFTNRLLHTERVRVKYLVAHVSECSPTNEQKPAYSIATGNHIDACVRKFRRNSSHVRTLDLATVYFMHWEFACYVEDTVSEKWVKIWEEFVCAPKMCIEADKTRFTLIWTICVWCVCVTVHLPLRICDYEWRRNVRFDENNHHHHHHFHSSFGLLMLQARFSTSKQNTHNATINTFVHVERNSVTVDDSSSYDVLKVLSLYQRQIKRLSIVIHHRCQTTQSVCFVPFQTVWMFWTTVEFEEFWKLEHFGELFDKRTKNKWKNSFWCEQLLRLWLIDYLREHFSDFVAQWK